MTDGDLQDCRILIVEDEYLLAEDLRAELAGVGAEIVGMAGTVDRALAEVDRIERLDGAVLDMNLGGEPVYPVADRLIAGGVPFVFTTGYDASAIPERYRAFRRCEKPVDMTRVVRMLRVAIGEGGDAPQAGGALS